MRYIPVETEGVSIVIGSFDRLKFLQLTITNLRRELSSLGLPSEIIVVDGGSADGSIDWLVAQKDIITIVQHNRGVWQDKIIVRRSWGYFMNLAFRSARYKYIGMFSDDCLLVPGSLKAGVDYFEEALNNNSKTAAVAFYWRNWPDQADYWVGLTLGKKLFVNHGLYLRRALASIGYIDEDSYHFYHADGDLCLRLWETGWECIACPQAFVEHHSHANVAVRKTNFERQAEDWKYYLERWSYLNPPDDPHYEGGWLYLSYKDVHETAKQFELVRQEEETDNPLAAEYGPTRASADAPFPHNALSYFSKLRKIVERRFKAVR